MAKRHKDLEFQLEDAGGSTRTFKTFDEACGLAVSIAASTGREVTIDVLAWSEARDDFAKALKDPGLVAERIGWMKAAARVWAGDYGVEVYEEDPEASVHERIVIKADAQDRIA